MKKYMLYLSLAGLLSGCQNMTAPDTSTGIVKGSIPTHLSLTQPSAVDINAVQNKHVQSQSRVQTTLQSPYKSPQIQGKLVALTKPNNTDNRLATKPAAKGNVIKIRPNNPQATTEQTKGRSKTVQIYKKIEADFGPKDTWQRLRNGFSLPDIHVQNPLQAHFETWYSEQKRYFHQISKRGYWYLPYILQEVEKRGMPTEIALIPAIESKYTPEAVSPSKAKGIWQFMAPTARHFGLAQNEYIDARSDLIESTQAALDYLQYLHDFFDGDWLLAIAAYNAGEGTIQRALRRNKRLGKPLHYSALDLKKEPTEYVPRLLAVRNIVKSPTQYNVELLEIPNAPTIKIVDSGSQIDLEIAASLIPLTAEELRSFNVAYKHGITPPEGPHHIAVPARYEAQLRQGLDALPLAQYMRWNRYRVQPGDVLGSIAKKHGTSVNTIKKANNLNSNIIRIGQTLKIPLIGGRDAQVTKKSKQGQKYHIVKSGDSLWQIARSNGVSVAYIQSLNNLSRNAVLKLGQRLRLTE